MPIPQFLKDLYYAFFDAYLREPVTIFVYALLRYWAPMVELKTSVHIIVDCFVPYLPEQEIYLLNIFCHSEIIGFFNWFLVLQYYFCWFLVYKVKEFIRCNYVRPHYNKYYREDDIIGKNGKKIKFYTYLLTWPLANFRRKNLIINYANKKRSYNFRSRDR